MDNKVIRINDYNDIESLKVFILQQLKLVDYKKNYVAEFDERVKNYIDRNKNLIIVLQFDCDKLEKDIKLYLSLTNGKPEPYPDNHEMRNPLNRWFSNSTIKTEDEIDKEEALSQRNLQDKLAEIKNFLEKLEKLGNGRICINNNNRTDPY
ncbi:MAG: hypothetical protein V4670_11265 [Bacteroidota bacterium]